MELKLNKSEINNLLELLYLGNWIANSTRNKDKRAEKFEKIFNKIKEQILPMNDFDDEKLHDKLTEYIEFYDSSILFSEFARQYANYKHPTKFLNLEKRNTETVVQYVSNSVTKDICEKELQTNGFKNVNIELPELSEQIKRKLDSIKN